MLKNSLSYIKKALYLFLVVVLVTTTMPMQVVFAEETDNSQQGDNSDTQDNNDVSQGEDDNSKDNSDDNKKDDLDDKQNDHGSSDSNEDQSSTSSDDIQDNSLEETISVSEGESEEQSSGDDQNISDLVGTTMMAKTFSQNCAKDDYSFAFQKKSEKIISEGKKCKITYFYIVESETSEKFSENLDTMELKDYPNDLGIESIVIDQDESSDTQLVFSVICNKADIDETFKLTVCYDTDKEINIEDIVLNTQNIRKNIEVKLSDKTKQPDEIDFNEKITFNDIKDCLEILSDDISDKEKREIKQKCSIDLGDNSKLSKKENSYIPNDVGSGCFSIQFDVSDYPFYNNIADIEYQYNINEVIVGPKEIDVEYNAPSEDETDLSKTIITFIAKFEKSSDEKVNTMNKSIEFVVSNGCGCFTLIPEVKEDNEGNLRCSYDVSLDELYDEWVDKYNILYNDNFAVKVEYGKSEKGYQIALDDCQKCKEKFSYISPTIGEGESNSQELDLDAEYHISKEIKGLGALFGLKYIIPPDVETNPDGVIDLSYTDQEIIVKPKKVGKATITLKTNNPIFFLSNSKTYTYKFKSPKASEDLLKYNGKNWNEINWENNNDGYYHSSDSETYWSREDIFVELVPGDRYFTKGKIKYKKDQDVKTIELDGKIDVEGAYDYQFELRNSSIGTFDNSIKKNIGIDKTAPTIARSNISTNKIVDKNKSITYFADEPTLFATFKDECGSGVNSSSVTLYYKDKDGVENSEQFDSKYTFKNGIYSDIHITIKDNVGNSRTFKLKELTGITTEYICVDTINPSVKIQANCEEGNWTNQKIHLTINPDYGYSGIKQIECTFIPTGEIFDKNAENWEIIESDQDGKYSYDFGEDFVPAEQQTVKKTPVTGTAPTDQSEIENRESEKNTITKKVKNGTIYIKITSNANRENNPEDDEENFKVRLAQRELGYTELYVDATPDGKTGWYNAKYSDKKPVFTFSYPNQLETSNMALGDVTGDAPKVTFYYEIKDTKGNNNKSGSAIANASGHNMTYDDIDSYTPEEDSIYEIKVWAEDEAGNKSDKLAYEVKADYTAPTNLKVEVEGKDITNEIGSSVSYNDFYNSGVSISAQGDFDVSGVESLKVYSAKNPGDKGKGTKHVFSSDSGSFSLEPNARCYFYVVATDVAGNESEIQSSGVVVDNEAPIGENGSDITITPEGANKNGFFNKDFNVKVEVQDSPTNDDCAALKEVNYKITNNIGKANEQNIFAIKNGAPSFSDLTKAQKMDETVTIKAADYESNTAYIEVTAIDNSDNKKVTQLELPIDVTKPVISVTYDNNQAKNDNYYMQNRTATIKVHEINFDPKDVIYKITKDGKEYSQLNPSVGSWRDDGDDHYANITFSEDGDYTVSLEYIDLADNEAEYSTVDRFTIDKTKPDVKVNYDNPTPWKDDFFNSSRTATITVTEHNFNAADFILTTTPEKTISNWTNDGDVHRATVSFLEDGEYDFMIDYVDMAGNRMDPYVQEHFKIDTIMPLVEIKGVEDGSANAGEVNPVIIMSDENFDFDGISINLRNGYGKDVDLNKKVVKMDKSCQIDISNVTQQPDSIYYLTASQTDMAGNTTEVTYRFSLNKNGSTYDLSNMSYLVEKGYNRYEDISDVEVLEMNIDTIENFSIYITRNGNNLESKEVSSRPDNMDDNIIYYSIEQSGNETLGYTYKYTIYKENFASEGTYNVMFYSKDRAGNEVNNTLTDKNAQITFMIDNTPPKVVIDGVEKDKMYLEDSIDVNVFVSDNFKLDQAEIYLVNQKGERIKTWNYMELTNGDEKAVTITLPSYEGKLSIQYRVVDVAGNELVTLSEADTPLSGIIITTNPWLRYINNKIAVGGTVAAVALAGVGTGIYYKKKRRKKLEVANVTE